MREVIFKNEEGIDDTVSLILWLEVIRQADLTNDLDYAIIGCSKDKDNKCRCLNSWVAAPIFNRGKLLKLREKVFEWLKKQRKFEPKIGKLFVIENVRQFFHITSLSEIEDKIKKMEYTSIVDEVQEIFERIIASPTNSKKNGLALADALDDINAYPCSREIMVSVDEPDKSGYVFVDQFGKVWVTKNVLLDWHYANENQEVIRKIREESWEKLLSEEEILKRGVKLVSIEENIKREPNKKK